MLKKRLISYMLVLGLLTSGSGAGATEPCDYEYFMDSILKLSEHFGIQENSIYVPEEYSSYSDAYIRAVSKGIVSFEELAKLTGVVSKQDAMNILYKMLISANPKYEVTPEEAEEILNTCYDNGYLREENKIAYAAMIKYGIIWVDGLTYPDRIVTKDSLSIIEERVISLFTKQLPVSVGGKEVFVGETLEELSESFGEPAYKIDNEFGFTWYVYDEYYANFIMIGIKDNIVCAYFTNAESMEFEGLKCGDTDEYITSVKGLNIIRNAAGEVDAVYYNPFSAEEAHVYKHDEQLKEFYSIINSNRVKNDLLPFSDAVGTSLRFLSDEGKKLEVNARSSIDAYINMLSTVEGQEMLSLDEKTSYIVDAKISGEENETVWNINLIGSENLSVPMSKINTKAEVKVTESEPEPIERIKTPKIVSPAESEVTEEGNLVIELEERCADEYFVTLYNVEKEAYDVYAFLKSSTNSIVIPSYMLTEGNVYRVCVNSVDGEEQLTGNMVEFTYGVCEEPLDVLLPEKDFRTYDDQIEVAVTSPAYREFKAEVFDSKGNLVTSKTLIGTYEGILDSVPAGTYKVKVTAISHATGMEMGSEETTVTIDGYEPIVTEFYLNPGEYYDFYPGDGIEWVYFYDTETVAVTEERTVKSSVNKNIEPEPEPEKTDGPPDWSGVKENKKNVVRKLDENMQELEVENTQKESSAEEAVSEATKTETYTVYKTKVIQKKVPATKRNRALAGLTQGIVSNAEYINSVTPSVGSTETGNAIVELALSFRGVPYVWGGTTPNGFDCSGLVKYVCNSLGIFNIARTSAQQFATSGKYVDRANLMPGDFVYFQKNGVIHHVGIYIGNNMMVHAPHTGDVVKISNLSESYYQREYAGAKRIY